MPRPDFRWMTLGELLAQSVVLSLHYPLTPEIKGGHHQPEDARAHETLSLPDQYLSGAFVVERDLCDAPNGGVSYPQ